MGLWEAKVRRTLLPRTRGLGWRLAEPGGVVNEHAGADFNGEEEHVARDASFSPGEKVPVGRMRANLSSRERRDYRN